MRSTDLMPGYLFDLDGTVYLGDKPIDGAAKVIKHLKDNGAKVGFLTNNSNRPREMHAARLRSMGIPAVTEDVITAAYVSVLWFLEHAPGSSLWIVGEQALIDKFIKAGFTHCTNPLDAQFVISSFDRTFDYAKLHGALTAIRAGARFIVTNPDRACPVDGDYLPDCGSITAAIQVASETDPEVIIGKPSPIIGRTALKIMGLNPDECMMVGDSLATDVAGGNAVGMPTTLVLTGVSSVADIERLKIVPNYICDGIWDLV